MAAPWESQPDLKTQDFLCLLPRDILHVFPIRTFEKNAGLRASANFAEE